MKREGILFLIIVSFLSNIVCFAQEVHDADNPVFNTRGLTYDSIMKALSDKTIPFDDKFEMVRDIESILFVAKVTDVYNTILLQAKGEKDKRYVADLYSAMSNNYQMINDMPNAKLYIDSAFIYEKEIENISSLALMNFIMSRYYNTIGEEDRSHDYLYKTIDYFEKTEGKKSTAILLLFQLSSAFNKHKDMSSLKKNMDRMLALLPDVDPDQSSVHVYITARSYYGYRFVNDGDVQYRDSLLYYGNKIIEIYENTDDLTKEIIYTQVTTNYFLIADVFSRAPNPDWNKIIEYVDAANKLASKGLSMQRGTSSNKVLKHRLEAKILLHNGNVDEALSEALESLRIMEQELSTDNFPNYIDTYSLLVKIYEEKRNFKLALHYLKLKSEIEYSLNNDRKYRTIKDLEVKFETTEKELKIMELNEEKQTLAYERALLIASMIIAVILLSALVVYLRLKKKEQERDSVLMSSRIEQKEIEYQALKLETEANKMRSYIDGVEVERERLSKDLHDDVSNELVVIKMQIENGVSNKQLIESLEKLHVNVRNISHGLIPPVFRDVTLTEVLEDYVFQQNSKAGLNLSIRLDNKEDLNSISDIASIEVYRIVQEAVGNAVKHAEAAQIIIHCYRADNLLKIMIIDNGKGFDAAQQYRGFGLRILKERATLIDGQLIISSNQLGSSVELSIPMMQEDK